MNLNHEFTKTEYTEVCQNLRHINDLRSKTMHYVATVSGILIVAITTTAGSDKFNGIEHGLFLSLIGLLGGVVSIGAYIVEKHSVLHFNLITERGVQIETEMSVEGQFVISDRELNQGNKKDKVSRSIGLVYVLLALFWVGAPLLVYLAKQ
ncbi:MAG: hypothetical protein H6980_06365 [Gammaproteobacteria bacterium]|nr:hypothetical protein [Gammaproteobacteria bacterium]